MAARTERMRARPACLVVALAVLGAACARPAGPAQTPDAAASVAAVAGPVFRDATAESGLDFVHDNGMSGRMYFVEMMGAGAALLDYDGDGDLDAYLPQGHALGPLPEAAAGADGASAGGRLFRNDLAVAADGQPGVRFTDVTDESGLAANGYGFGVATGDYDNDGDVDLYLANWGPNQLWRNEGNGTFTDVTAVAGADDPRWSSGASFVDYDRDGWLDLIVVNYNQYSLEADHPCFNQKSGRRDYCGPTAYPADPSRLLRNRGDGTFEDVSAALGITSAYGPALGVTATDLTGDGWPDLFVANDGHANTFWVNDQGQRFREEALLRGVAVNRVGATEANMGVVAADLDGDCDDDLYVTHLDDEMNTFWVNDGGGVFEDRTPDTGVGPVSLPYTGFGVAPLDIDGDGHLDLFVANGAVLVLPEQEAAGDPLPLRQTNLLFRNLGGRRFEDVTDQAGAFMERPAVGRGVAMGDVDNDGDADLLVSYNHGPAQLLLNEVGSGNPWLGLRLVTGPAGRDALGGQVALRLSDGRRLCRRVHTDGSYASAQDARVLFGLGGAARPATVEVRWPDGMVEAFPAPEPNAYHTLRQGTGDALGGGS